ncbi:hypothetical protein C7443_10499 [Plasticicumulans acidivorans]|uniref:UPF0235 protein C7443_10499 n=2 Tax=Plasticicumulans acidivorans TaxID=886464 RepID=A0A317MWF2_9GAMM|nr:hypothetical protein C7443_10499 [Plasticicumulans acidivorans]
MPMSAWYRWDGADLIVEVRVQPRAGRDAFGEVQDGRLRVRLGAPPVDGQANARLCALLGDAFGVPKSAVMLLAGDHSREKRLRIRAPRRLPDGVTADDSVNRTVN